MQTLNAKNSRLITVTGIERYREMLVVYNDFITHYYIKDVQGMNAAVDKLMDFADLVRSDVSFLHEKNVKFKTHDDVSDLLLFLFGQPIIKFSRNMVDRFLEERHIRPLLAVGLFHDVGFKTLFRSYM